MDHKMKLYALLNRTFPTKMSMVNVLRCIFIYDYLGANSSLLPIP